MTLNQNGYKYLQGFCHEFELMHMEGKPLQDKFLPSSQAWRL